MDIDRFLVAIGGGKREIERCNRVLIDQRWIERAEDISAVLQCFIQQLACAGTAQHPRLREGDDLNSHHVLQRLARLDRAVQMPQARVCVDVDVRPQLRRSEREKRAGERKRLFGGIVLRGGAPCPLVFDALHERRAHVVSDPWHAPVRLVEMRMAFHQARQHECALTVFMRGMRVTLEVGTDLLYQTVCQVKPRQASKLRRHATLPRVPASMCQYYFENKKGVYQTYPEHIANDAWMNFEPVITVLSQ